MLNFKYYQLFPTPKCLVFLQFLFFCFCWHGSAVLSVISLWIILMFLVFILHGMNDDFEKNLNQWESNLNTEWTTHLGKVSVYGNLQPFREKLSSENLRIFWESDLNINSMIISVKTATCPGLILNMAFFSPSGKRSGYLGLTWNICIL